MKEIDQLKLLIQSGTATPEQQARYEELVSRGAGINATSANAGLFDINPGPKNPNSFQGMPQNMFGTQTTTSSPQFSIEGAGSQYAGPDNPRAYGTRDEYIEARNKMGYDSAGSGEMWDKAQTENTDNGAPKTSLNDIPFLFAGGSDISTELYSLGRSIGAEKGSKGRLLSGIAAGGAAVMDIARNVASGIGFEKRNQYIEDWNRKQQNKVEYTPNSQTRNTNNIGGFMEDGGQVPETLPQEGQQIMQAVVTMLQQGAQPDQVVQALVQQGVPEEQAMQMVQQATQGAQEQQQQAPSMFADGGYTLDPKEVADAIKNYSANLEGYNNNPKAPSGAPSAGGDWIPITPAERDRRIKEFEAMDPADVGFSNADTYLALKSGDPFYVDKATPTDPSKYINPPVNWDKHKGLIPASWMPTSKTPATTTTPAAVPANDGYLYLAVGKKGDTPRQVTKEEYMKLPEELKTKMVIGEQGKPIVPGTGGTYYNEPYVKMEDGGMSNNMFQMKDKGLFDKREGEKIKFMFEGKEISGTIKSIDAKTGKITLK